MYRISATYLPCEDMHFDREYYERHHVPLARRQLDGRVEVLAIRVEYGQVSLFDPRATTSPCIFSIVVDGERDVEDFRRFMQSEHVEPLKADVAEYTNCEIAWNVGEIREY